MTGAIRLTVIILLTSCDAIAGPSNFDNAAPIVADTAFARVWRDVEDCSGLRGDFSAVRWFRSEQLPQNNGAAAHTRDMKIVIHGPALDNWCGHHDDPELKGCLFTDKIIGHEVAHLLERTTRHPMPLFSKRGPCKDVIQTMD